MIKSSGMKNTIVINSACRINKGYRRSGCLCMCVHGLETKREREREWVCVKILCNSFCFHQKSVCLEWRWMIKFNLLSVCCLVVITYFLCTVHTFRVFGFVFSTHLLYTDWSTNAKHHINGADNCCSARIMIENHVFLVLISFVWNVESSYREFERKSTQIKGWACWMNVQPFTYQN